MGGKLSAAAGGHVFPEERPRKLAQAAGRGDSPVADRASLAENHAAHQQPARRRRQRLARQASVGDRAGGTRRVGLFPRAGADACLFQALDAQGRAVQTMRSLTYLQPGEQAACVGCHEQRSTSTPERGGVLAIAREPSPITPGPCGSRPLSYPLLVQPVLDRQCIACHKAEKPEGKVVLTGEPAGTFSRSYNCADAVRRPNGLGNPANNYEPLTAPDRFGARASKLVGLLDRGHYGVSLSPDDWDRIVTWIDANALFYGTFNPQNQARQLRGEQIAGPDLE